MNKLDAFSVSITVLGMSAFCWSTVIGACQQGNFHVQPLCNTNSSYGNVLGDYTTPGLIPCSAKCTRHMPNCKSFTYDEATGRCIIRDSALIEISKRDINVKYGIVGLRQCVGTDGFKICSTELHAVPGQIRGHLLANINGKWGTVCDDGWESVNNGVNNANVVCKSIGYSSGTPLPAQSSYYTGLIAMDDIKCTGAEMSLLACPYITTHNCSHNEDVLVMCTE